MRCRTCNGRGSIMQVVEPLRLPTIKAAELSAGPAPRIEAIKVQCPECKGAKLVKDR